MDIGWIQLRYSYIPGRLCPFRRLNKNFASLREKLYTRSMSTFSSDTPSKMEALQIKLWRQATPARKMQMLAQLNASAYMLALTGLHSQYPQASKTELRRRQAGLLLGDEMARKVYGEISDAK